MTGEECVAECSDLRYGRELQTIATDFPKVSREISVLIIVIVIIFVIVIPAGVRDEPAPVGGPPRARHRHTDRQAED